MLYLDSSALTKLVVDEPESGALESYLRGGYTHSVASELARVEVYRAVRRTKPVLTQRAEEVLADILLLAIDEEVIELAAARLDPGLRGLDAIHLASALTVRADIDAFVTYDQRLRAAAAMEGFKVVAPEAV